MSEFPEELVNIERKLWTNDAAFYNDNLTEDCLLVFPETANSPTGWIKEADEISELIHASPDDDLSDWQGLVIYDSSVQEQLGLALRLPKSPGTSSRTPHHSQSTLERNYLPRSHTDRCFHLLAGRAVLEVQVQS